jgi:L-lysine exporter family protein LysE/ArgO
LTAIFLHGALLALGLILPLGVQNLFIFNQGAVQPHFYRVLPIVLTAALCDTFLIVLAVLGVSVIVLEVLWLKTLLMGFGILFLLYMAVSTWKSKPAVGSEGIESFAPKKKIAFAASVSLLNPHAIMDTVGVIGTNSLHYAGMEKAVFTLSCIAVSWVWFTGLALAGRSVGRLNRSPLFLQGLNKVSALIMWGTASYLGYSLLTG